MHVCAILGPLDGLFASSMAQHSANAKPSMCPRAAFKAAFPPGSQKALRLRYNKQEYRLHLQREKCGR